MIFGEVMFWLNSFYFLEIKFDVCVGVKLYVCYL